MATGTSWRAFSPPPSVCHFSSVGFLPLVHHLTPPRGCHYDLTVSLPALGMASHLACRPLPSPSQWLPVLCSVPWFPEQKGPCPTCPGSHLSSFSRISLPKLPLFSLPFSFSRSRDHSQSIHSHLHCPPQNTPQKQGPPGTHIVLLHCPLHREIPKSRLWLLFLPSHLPSSPPSHTDQASNHHPTKRYSRQDHRDRQVPNPTVTSLNFSDSTSGATLAQLTPPLSGDPSFSCHPSPAPQALP